MWPGKEKKWYFNVKTKKVEYGRISSLMDVMGPYDTEADARLALEKAAEANAKWDAEGEVGGEGSEPLDDFGNGEEEAEIKQDPKGEEDTPSAIF